MSENSVQTHHRGVRQVVATAGLAVVTALVTACASAPPPATVPPSATPPVPPTTTATAVPPATEPPPAAEPALTAEPVPSGPVPPSHSAPPTSGSGTGPAPPQDPAVQPGTRPPIEPYPTPPVESTDRPLPGNPDTADRPRVINRPAGPTLDAYWGEEAFYFRMPDDSQCVTFGNGESEYDVTVRDVKIVDDGSDGSSAFRIVRESSLDDCGLGGGTAGWCRRGAQLPGYAEDAEDRAACAVEVRFIGTTDHTARLEFSLEVRCTDAGKEPCKDVADRRPTPEEPVIVRWPWYEDLEAHLEERRDDESSSAEPTRPPDEARDTSDELTGDS